jgi:hypothetical protein
MAVTLWDMLTLISGASAFGCALAAARIAGGGATNVTVAAALGLAVGASCIWIIRKVGQSFGRDISDTKARVLYASATLWILASACSSGTSTPNFP